MSATFSEKESELVDQMNPTAALDELNVPTLMSKSPPSSPTENEKSVNDFDLNSQMANFSLVENSPNQSHSNSDPFTEFRPLTEHENHAPNNEHSATQIDFNWNPFESVNENTNDHLAEEGNWADFEQVQFEKAPEVSMLNQTNQTIQNTEKSDDDKLETNRTEVKAEEREGVQTFKEEEDDEWADFVDTTTPHTNIQMLNDLEPNQTQVLKSNEVQQQIQHVQPDSNQKESANSVNQFDFFNLIDNLLNQKLNTAFFNVNESSANKLRELLIDEDTVWHKLKTYTSITDESISLKFKWNRSSIEESYLKSLNLEKVLPNQKPFSATNFLSNQILKPVKLEEISSSSSTQLNASSNQTVYVKNENGHVEKLDSMPTLTKKAEDLDKKSEDGLSLNLDLSYFESKPAPLSNNSTKSFESIGKSSESSSKVYLDKLLQEIFVNNTSTSTTTPNKSDNHSDKKSISSSSSSSSSNIAEMSIQLQPHKLEQQQLNDLVNMNKASDQQAIDLLSKLPDLSFMKTSLVYPVFPAPKPAQQQQQQQQIMTQTTKQPPT